MQDFGAYVSHIQFDVPVDPYDPLDSTRTEKHSVRYLLAESSAKASSRCEELVREEFPNAIIRLNRILAISDDFILEAATRILQKRGMM